MASASDFLQRHRLALRSWILFLAIFGALQGLFVLSGSAAQQALIEWTAWGTAAILDGIGANGRVDGTIVTSDLFAVEIILECTGIFPTLMFVAAVLAYPCAWRAKLAGVGLGVPAMLLLNQIRLVSLCFIGHWAPAVFSTAHLLVWQSLMIFLTVLLWSLWAVSFAGTRARSAA